MIRKFDFKNNYLTTEAYDLNASYCSIGYFDGMETTVVAGKEAGDQFSAARMELQSEEQFLEKCDHFYVIGLRDEPDDDFWQPELDEKRPILFISCIRLKRFSPHLKKIREDLEESFPYARCYNTLDSSDLVVALRTESYVEGCTAVECIYPAIISGCDPAKGKVEKNGIRKCFTIPCIAQRILDDTSKLDERLTPDVVCCDLGCVIHDLDKVDTFYQKLQVESGIQWKRYGTLGSNDIIFRSDGIKVSNLFAMYANKLSPKGTPEERGLLTHGNQLYKSAFLNICTSIQVSETLQAERRNMDDMRHITEKYAKAEKKTPEKAESHPKETVEMTESASKGDENGEG